MDAFWEFLDTHSLTIVFGGSLVLAFLVAYLGHRQEKAAKEQAE
jgi:hypothetical protein